MGFVHEALVVLVVHGCVIVAQNYTILYLNTTRCTKYMYERG